MIPSKEECLDLMKEYNMLEHIVRHSILVNKIALYLSEELNKNGEKLDLSKVQAGALLHDITKTRSIKTRENHATTGGKLLDDLGFKDISEIVIQHVMIDDNVNSSRITETEIINYADKRVKHDKAVTLKERFDDLRERYGTDDKRVYMINRSKCKTMKLEKKIFSRLNITSDALLSIS